MTILVCGSRTWTDPARIVRELRSRTENTVGTRIIHGNAIGADQLAGDAARQLGLSVRAYPAEWERYGKSAGYRRNTQMLDESPDLVLAFWDGQSKGTAHTIAEARRRGIPIHVVTKDTRR